MSLRRRHESLAQGLGVRAVYVFSSIEDEGALVKRSPYKMEGQFIPTRLHYTRLGVFGVIIGVKYLELDVFRL